MCVGLICASVISLKPFFVRYFPSLLKTSPPPPDAVRPNFSWLANPASNSPANRYELGQSKGSQENCTPQKSTEQSCADNAMN